MAHLTIDSGRRQFPLKCRQQSFVFVVKLHFTIFFDAIHTNFKMGLVWRIVIKAVKKDSWLVEMMPALVIKWL